LLLSAESATQAPSTMLVPTGQVSVQEPSRQACPAPQAASHAPHGE
jgi:hypothetical protein